MYELMLLKLTIGLLILKTLAEVILEFLNQRELKRHAGAIPEAYKEVMDDEAYEKSQAYTLGKSYFSNVSSLWDMLFLIWLLVSGVLPWYFEGIESLLGSSIWTGAASLFILGIALEVISLPFDWYRTFRLEARYGFNKSTYGLWIGDKIKGAVIGAIIGIPLLALLLWIVQTLPMWWIWGFGVFFCFQLIMMVVYPMWIMPLFNKFEPLEEGDLRQRLMSLADRAGFLAKTILVMDGSKRSAHSNAFFTGFGAFRRIVLFDTLMEQLEPRELEAVLAHEIGHYKKGHIPKMLLMNAAFIFLAFYLIGWLAESGWFLEGFGFSVDAGLVPVLFLFSIVSSVISFWISPIFNILSRKHEYEADAFAREQLGGDPMPLIKALHKLSEKNLSNLTPHPFYSSFYYSHPTLGEREAALKEA